MSGLVQASWYQKLIEDIKLNTFYRIVEAKHYTGKRILRDFEKFGKPEYGNKYVENIAKDLGSSRADVYSCIQFARAYPELSNQVRQLGWKDIRQNLLPPPKTNQETEIPPLPEGKYNIIYADPPWPISTSTWDKWEENIEQKYPLMPIEQIEALPIGKLAHDNTHLFLWATLTFLPEAVRLIGIWGFKYHICLTWNKGRGFTLFGYYRNSEFLIHSYRGKMLAEWEGEAFHTSFTEASTKHSRKPDIVYSFLEGRYKAPRIELFAREKREGWDSWGNEV